MNRRQIGSNYEQAAATYLSRQGYQILCMNYRCYCGEIDIIAKEKDTLVFIEVKYRRTSNFGDPAQAVNKKKQWKIYKSAQFYMKEHAIRDVPCRFDIVAIQGEQIRIIKNAFGGM
jgi:putative endonuclease